MEASLMRQARRAAAEFYYKPSGITGYMQDWIEGRIPTHEDLDEDVVSLSSLLMDFYLRGQASMRPK